VSAPVYPKRCTEGQLSLVHNGVRRDNSRWSTVYGRCTEGEQSLDHGVRSVYGRCTEVYGRCSTGRCTEVYGSVRQVRSTEGSSPRYFGRQVRSYYIYLLVSSAGLRLVSMGQVQLTVGQHTGLRYHCTLCPWTAPPPQPQTVMSSWQRT